MLCHLSSLLESKLSLSPIFSNIISSTPQSESLFIVGIGSPINDDIQKVDFY